jgi:hypothetical protein
MRKQNKSELDRALNALRELELGVSTHADRERCARVHLWLVTSGDAVVEAAGLKRRIAKATAMLERTGDPDYMLEVDDVIAALNPSASQR